MNVKDLMIGDWIMYKSDSPENAFFKNINNLIYYYGSEFQIRCW